MALFKRAMLAFPSTMRSLVGLISRLTDYEQTERFEENVEITVSLRRKLPADIAKPAYGVQIEYSPELLAQIANGELIKDTLSN